VRFGVGKMEVTRVGGFCSEKNLYRGEREKFIFRLGVGRR
jgi:hypothetical protein